MNGKFHLFPFFNIIVVLYCMKYKNGKKLIEFEKKKKGNVCLYVYYLNNIPFLRIQKQ